MIFCHNNNSRSYTYNAMNLKSQSIKTFGTHKANIPTFDSLDWGIWQHYNFTCVSISRYFPQTQATVNVQLLFANYNSYCQSWIGLLGLTFKTHRVFQYVNV